MSADDPASNMLDYLVLPPEFMQAEPWARRMYQELREHRQQTNDALAVMSAQLAKHQEILGREPNSDGHGGAGLLGDLGNVVRDVHDLKNLKLMGAGFVSAVTLFGALIFMGIGQWFTNLMSAKH